jgi:hypothetical protein
MAKLSFSERNTREQLFQMGGGWVLDFSNRTLSHFVADACEKNFDDPIYDEGSNSKAKRLRKFWDVEADRAVGLVIDAMAQHAATLPNTEQTLVPIARDIAKRLLKVGSVAELDAIAPTGASRTFDALALAVREAIENDKPETGLDRLHTYTISYLRQQCARNGMPTKRDEPLNSVFGKYIQLLRNRGLIQSEMTSKILKMSLATLDAFNFVRNEQRLAHDNEILDSDESLFIFNYVCALVRFLQQIDPLQMGTE